MEDFEEAEESMEGFFPHNCPEICFTYFKTSFCFLIERIFWNLALKLGRSCYRQITLAVTDLAL